jgi:hypothetical protein
MILIRQHTPLFYTYLASNKKALTSFNSGAYLGSEGGGILKIIYSNTLSTFFPSLAEIYKLNIRELFYI